MFTLCICEFLVRILDLGPKSVIRIQSFHLVDNPRIVYDLIPGGPTEDGILNNQGFKDEDFLERKPAHTVRIAMLGDSITYGLLVSKGKTFSDQLELLLNERARLQGNTMHYAVMNFGVSGYNLIAEVETLKTKVLQYDPDIVVLNLFHNDLEPLPAFIYLLGNDSGISLTQREAIFRKYCSAILFWWQRLLYHSKLYIFLTERLRLFSARGDPLHGFVKKHYNTICTEADKTLMRKEFRRIKEMQREYGFKFMICIHPHLAHGEHPNNKVFTRIAQEFSFPYVRMAEYYKKEKLASADLLQLSGNPEDVCHPTELGHSIIAKAIFAELKKNHFIDLP